MASTTSLTPGPSRGSPVCGVSAEGNEVLGPINQMGRGVGWPVTLGTPPTSRSAFLSPLPRSPLWQLIRLSLHMLYTFLSRPLLTLFCHLGYPLLFLQLPRFFFKAGVKLSASRKPLWLDQPRP